MANSLNSNSGVIKDGIHSFPIRVYYEDTDAGGIVYHSQYLNFMERGRTEMLRMCGLEHAAMMTTQTSPTMLVVKSMNIDFKRPATLDDELVVTSEISKLGAVSMMISQCVLKGDDALVTAEVKVGIIGGDKRPKKLDSDTRSMILNKLNISS